MRMCVLSCSVWLRRAIQDLISVQNHFFLLNLVSVPYQFFSVLLNSNWKFKSVQFHFFHFYWIRFQLVFSFFQFGWISTELYFKFVLHLFSFFSILLNFDWKAIHSVFSFFHFYWKSTEPWSFSSNSAQIQFYWIWTEANSVDIQFFSVLLKSYWFGFSRASVFFSSTEFELNF